MLGTIVASYGFYYDGGGTLPGGTLSAAYGAFFNTPVAGAKKIALYSDDFVVGFAGSVPPTNGAIIFGNVGLAIAAPLSPLSVNGGVAIGPYSGTNVAPTNGLIVSGNVSFGSPSTTSLFNVGSSNQFKVTSGGTVNSTASANFSISISLVDTTFSIVSNGTNLINMGGSEIVYLSGTGTKTAQTSIDLGTFQGFSIDASSYQPSANIGLIASYLADPLIQVPNAVTVTNAVGFLSSPDYSLGAATGTITVASGFYYDGGSTATNTTITTQYGIYCAEPVAGTTKIAGKFLGRVDVGTTAQFSISRLGVVTAGTWNGTAIDETHGGTNQTAYTQGDTLYASAANTLSKLAKDTNATRYLSNTGTSNNPAWAQVALGTGVSGTLPVANGGTNASTFTAGSVVFAGTSGTYTQDNANFFWDATNHFIGLKTASPLFVLDARNATATTPIASIGKWTGSNGAPTLFGTPYLKIGGAEFGSGALYTIGFAYQTASADKPAVEIGAVTTDSTGARGIYDFVIATSTANSLSTAAVERFRITSAGVLQLQSASFSANGVTATVLTGVGPAGASTTVQEWLTIKDAGGTTRYIPCF